MKDLDLALIHIERSTYVDGLKMTGLLSVMVTAKMKSNYRGRIHDIYFSRWPIAKVRDTILTRL